MSDEEIKVFILLKDERFHVMLRHPDGSEELSHQSYATREECVKAIKQYAKDRNKLMSKSSSEEELREFAPRYFYKH